MCWNSLILTWDSDSAPWETFCTHFQLENVDWQQWANERQCDVTEKVFSPILFMRVRAKGPFSSDVTGFFRTRFPPLPLTRDPTCRIFLENPHPPLSELISSNIPWSSLQIHFNRLPSDSDVIFYPQVESHRSIYTAHQNYLIFSQYCRNKVLWNNSGRRETQSICLCCQKPLLVPNVHRWPSYLG